MINRDVLCCGPHILTPRFLHNMTILQRAPHARTSRALVGSRKIALALVVRYHMPSVTRCAHSRAVVHVIAVRLGLCGRLCGKR